MAAAAAVAAAAAKADAAQPEVDIGALLPEVPTAQELGHKVALDAWRGIAVPRGTPKSAIATLENAIRQTVQSSEFISGSNKLFVKPAFLPAAEFGVLMAREDAELATLMRGIGIKK